jgi:amidase
VTASHELSAVEARRLIGARKLSARELLKSCLDRISKTNKTYNAVVAIDEKVAKVQADAADAAVKRGEPLGLLQGLPVAIKDLEEVKGLRTTWGSLIYKDHVPKADNPMVANVRKAGANIFAKTNTPEFGAGANTRNRVYGATGNPFDPKLTPAGSSGGSAVALALNQFPLATGSDYGGSLRTPAAFCGVVGFRPSVGVVPASERAAGLLPWGVLGPMGRTVEDAHLLLRAQLALDRRDPYSSSDYAAIPEVLQPADLSACRVAVTPDLGVCPVDKMIAKTLQERVRSFKNVFASADGTAPDFAGVHEIFEVHRGLAFVAGHQERLEKHRDLLDRNVIDNTERGLKWTASEIATGFVEQTKLYKRFNAFFENYDAILCPGASVSPFPHSQLFVEEINGQKMPTYMRWLALSYAPTMALACAAVIPCGRDAKGLPFGLQIIGPKGSDAKILAIALALEQVLHGIPETRRPVPDV